MPGCICIGTCLCVGATLGYAVYSYYQSYLNITYVDYDLVSNKCSEKSTISTIV